MIYILEIWRQRSIKEKGCFRKYLYETDCESATVASALSELNKKDTLTDMNGKITDKIVWECSCMQKKCGACAMVINGRPCLACDTKLYGNKSVRIEPLRKFPIIADLMVNRDIIFDNLSKMKVWAEKEMIAADKKNDLMYEASRCLQCGCCLEVCPNFVSGGKFFGMSAMIPSSRLLTGLDKHTAADLRKQFGKRITDGCGKSFACRNICPAGIDIENLMARSDAVVLWSRFFRK